jgi:hypothetical protein
MRSPGFTAQASLSDRPGNHLFRRSRRSDVAVVPAQFNLGHLPGGRRVVDDCPPGQRLVFVPDQAIQEYCTGKRPVYDLGQMALIWEDFTYPCGWQFAPAHWECQLPAFQVVG